MAAHLLQSVLLLQFMLSVVLAGKKATSNQVSSIFFQRMALIFRKMQFVTALYYQSGCPETALKFEM